MADHAMGAAAYAISAIHAAAPKLNVMMPEWHYLDTTKLDTHDFARSREFGQAEAEAKEAQSTGDARWFRRWPLKQLREELKIFPVE